MASVGRNIVFPIKNADGTPFHNLVLRKATVDSVVMSLGDKITGDVYYKDNTIQCSMQEYVKYNNVKYTIVNPPTIVREGLVKDNSDLKGMTKYSFEFYHPMYILGNLPFSDVAVSNDEKKYLSQNKTFSWIGKPQDYINKINKNLEGTEWIVVKSDRFPQEKDDELSDVLSFDNNTIADALKTGYDTWGLPYVVSQINKGEPYYSQGKRFKVEFGLPSNEILVDNEPYIFQFGQGVGLKNNSRTPRNNKIITRIAGYGSENNIPYGYPQIRWYGDQSATQTPDGYPIYDGIVGGAVRKLIKHPFTRTHLMPSIYTQTVFNKVSPYLANGSANPDYNPDEEIVDYYDAIYSEEYPYINEINLLSPSYEIHEFADVKPELDSDRQLGIVSAIPLNQDLTPASKWDDTYDAEKDEYIQSYFRITLPQLSFDLYACASITEEMQINMRSGACIGCTFPIQVDWENYKKNFYDADGNFLPDGSQRDLTKYPKSNLGQIDIIVQKETQTFGTLMPNIYQKPMANDLFVILGISLPLEYITNAEERLDDAMKSYMLENNVYYYDYPLKFDEHFLATHPNILSQIRPNSIIRFGFKGYPDPLELFVKQITVKYGEGVLPQYDITLTDNIEVVLNQIGQVADDVEKLGSLVAILRQTYNRNIWSELDKKLSKVKDDSTPHKLGMGEMQVDGDANIGGNASIAGDTDIDGNTKIKTSLEMGDDDYIPNEAGCKIYHNGAGWMIETDYLSVNKKMYAKSIQVDEVEHVGGENLLTDASCMADKVLWYDSNGNITENRLSVAYFRVFFRKKNGEGRTIYNRFRKGDQAYCQIFNIDKGTTEDFTNRYYWRLVIKTSNENGTYDERTTELLDDCHFIDLSATDCDGANVMLAGVDATDVPQPEDPIVQLGYRRQSGDDDATVTERQGATLISGGGKYRRSLLMWEGIGSGEGNPVQTIPQKYYYMPSPRVKLSPHDVKLIVDSFYLRIGGQDKTIEDLTGIYAIECSTVLVSTNSINNTTPVILGGQMNSTLYAVQLGDYLLRMTEEEDGGMAVITCKPALQRQDGKDYLTTGTLTAYNVRGNEIISTIGSSSSGELTFNYTDIDLTCDVVRVVYTIEGVEYARSSISIVTDGVNAKFHQLQDNGSYARIRFEDRRSTSDDGYITFMGLQMSINVGVNIVDGDDKYPIDVLSDYELLVRYSVQQGQIATWILTSDTSVFSGEKSIVISDVNDIGYLSKTITLILKQSDTELVRVELPVIMDADSEYTRTKIMMQSLYSKDGSVSLIKQVADGVSAKVNKLGSQFLPTGWDVEHLKMLFTANDVEFKNNSGNKTAWMDAFGNFTVAGVFNNLITVIDPANVDETKRVGGDLIIKAYYRQNASTEDWDDFYKYELDEGESEDDYQVRYYIDILRCGDAIVIKSLPEYGSIAGDVNYRLPYFATNRLQDRGHTRFGNDGGDSEPHMMSADELRMLVGRKIIIKSEVDGYNGAYTRITGLNTYVLPNSYTLEHLANDRLYFLYNKNDTATGIIPLYTDNSFSLVPQVVHLSFSQVAWFHEDTSTVSDSYIKGFGYVWTGGQQALGSDLEDLNWDNNE